MSYKDKKLNREERTKKRDTDDYFNRWTSAEDEIDYLRDEIRNLKDENSKLKAKLERTKND
ncbi:hypothetical protein [Lactobacillus xujianguonis]|uniref:hypothetical protein n=1 Tax=Lactobacillus xujianguonis TaxID=2495899 RepID=UPI000FD9AFFE|nr:hypothetical protein [Lactobacillus xujianguonis]RVU73774.1 hypothetical protein EJK20_06195 [Lactobacillus xujianguonis]